MKFVEAQHSHNIFLEIAHNFGVPLSIIIICSFIIIFIRVFLNLKNIDNNYEYFVNKTWLVSCLSISLVHMTDITYYEGKISLLISILFAGLITCTRSNNKKDKKQIYI